MSSPASASPSPTPAPALVLDQAMLARHRRRSRSPTLSQRSLDGILSWKKRMGYGMGHILNDLCASMWFTYLLLFFHRVLNFNNVYAGIVLFTGQIADGLSTLFVGYFSDDGDDLWLCYKYGKRKSWHLIGTLCVVVSFPFIFLPCVGCSDADDYAQLVYYAAFVVIFQFGWAATQISHLAMIPDLTPDQNERTGLTAIRYGMTVGANISVYLVTWIFLGIGSQDSMIGPNDAESFRNIMIFCVTMGAFCSLMFHTLVRIEPFQAIENRMNAPENLRPPVARKMSTKDWLCEPQFYLVAGVYMTTRLFVNLTQAYIPLYLQVTLQLKSTFVAIIPLVMFVFSLIMSTLMKPINRIIGRKATFVIGALIGLAGTLWIKLASQDDIIYKTYEIYGVAALIGGGGSVMLITSLALTAELIGQNPESGAFVYGSMSLSDKVSNGVAVVLIQNFIPGTIDTCTDCQLYYRDILFYVCGGAAILGALFIGMLIPHVVGVRWRDRRPTNGYESLPGGVDPSSHLPEYQGGARRQDSTGSSSQGQNSNDERTPLIA